MIFHKGQKVQCIRDDFSRAKVFAMCGYNSLPKKGGVYTVASYCGCNQLRLQEFPTEPGDFCRAFEPDFFRPLQNTNKRTDISVFKKLLKPAPTKRVKEDA